MQRLISEDGKPLSDNQKNAEISASHIWQIIPANSAGKLKDVR